MATITFPDGSQLTSTALTDNQIQTAFQYITAQALGYMTDARPVDIVTGKGSYVCQVVGSANVLYKGLAITGVAIQPESVIESVDYVNSTITLSKSCISDVSTTATVNDPMVWSKVRIGWQPEGQPGPSFDDDTVFVRCSIDDTEYAHMHDVTGSASDDGTKSIQTDVFTRSWKTYWTFYGPNSTDLARALHSILVTIQFVADFLADRNLYVNPEITLPSRSPELFQGRWWERSDLEARFNEQVTETFIVGTVKTVEVKTYTKDGLLNDFTVTTP